MPYIRQERREALDRGEPMEGPGELTFLLQQTIKRYWTNSPENYRTIAEILGSLQGARFDFEQRIVKDYERKKLEENGDVW
jgi:hypothetical protein